ncbi:MULTISPECIES: DUF3573 domain-containing protein [unclassified Francisella]|uniref:DUF3573 domain-containing protein n=1 Tax=unclassified Francisella TaxID=2610885 RepID=UPI002E342EF6|nr:MULTISPECIES: DUF3573 domain-containing protein [unclassified Francisella]MED7819966.1 DUF3573 domain-containing protein [Francisella sp. 19S2-4]MED7830786.1 DUF3573 domain-containing protein [Francisella sp. 19S2-10]
MVQKLKKSFILISYILICADFGYSESSPDVVSQGGPLGAVSIGDQNINNTSNTSTANDSKDASSTTSQSPSQNSSSQNINEKELLLKLQEQVQQLQGQLQQIKAQKGQINNMSGGSSQFATYSTKVYNNEPNTPQEITGGDLSQTLVGGQTASDIMENVNSSNSIIDLGNKSLGGVFNSTGGIDVGGAPAITTQGQVTFLGSYSGNNSIPIGQISSNLFASTLLGQREKFDDYMIFFGGFIEADAQAWWGTSNVASYNNGASTLSATGENIYLTNAKLFFLSNLGHYVTAQFDFDTSESGTFGLGNAFVIFGNLDTSPFFVTAGRSKLSVGTYGGGGPWTSGITSFLAPDKVTNVSVNYKDQVWNANISVFGTDDQTADFSAGLFYVDSWTENLIGAFNVGYVYNMAGAGNSSLSDFLTNEGLSSATTIGAFNVDANVTYGLLGGFLNLGAGWSTTTNAADFNGTGDNVLTGAWYGAANYSLVLGGRNTSFGLSYGQSYNAADVPMTILATSPINAGPTTSGVKEQFIVNANRAYFDNNVLFGPEYAYQKLYNGQYMNTITLDMSVYI